MFQNSPLARFIDELIDIYVFDVFHILIECPVFSIREIRCAYASLKE